MSALEKIVKVPECFIIDYMHQVLLGVVKRTVVNIYRQKGFNLSHEKKVSSFLEGCKLPLRETNRQLRALSTVKSWKASELKSFLLYGFTCFYGTLGDKMFSHFFLLSSSIRILLETEKLAVDIAEKLIDIFRLLLPYFYGETAQTFNAHALSHLADQVRVAGPLSSLSAMPFESAHFQLKRAIGPTTNSSCAAKLAVKKQQRQFFATANLKRKNSRPSLTVGELRLKSQRRVQLDTSNENYFSAVSFEFIGKNFYCHDSNCRWQSTGTCVHMVVYFCNNELSCGQLVTVIASIENVTALVLIRKFSKIETLREFLQNSIADLDTSDDVEENLAVDHLLEGLDVLQHVEDKHFWVSELNEAPDQIDLNSLVCPAIAHSVGQKIMVSALCTVFERD